MNYFFRTFQPPPPPTPYQNTKNQTKNVTPTVNGGVSCVILGIDPCQNKIQYNKLSTAGNDPSVSKSTIMSQTVRTSHNKKIIYQTATLPSTPSLSPYPYSILWYDIQDKNTIYNAVGFHPHMNDNIKKIMNKATNSLNTINLNSIDVNSSYTTYIPVSIGGKTVNSIYAYDNTNSGFITDNPAINLTSGFSSFLVFSTNTPVGTNVTPPEIWCKVYSGTPTYTMFDGYSNVRTIGDGTNVTTGVSSFDVSQPFSGPTPVLFYNEFNTTTNTYNEFVNSVNTCSFSSPYYNDTTGHVFLGNKLNDYHGFFYYYEFVVYPSALSSFNRQLIEGWLAWKYNIQSQLPNGHPYYGSPPSFIPIQ